MENEDIWLEIIKEMESRRQIGLETYGAPVTSTEDTDWLTHLTDELYDAICYGRAYKKLVDKLKSRVSELEDRVVELEEKNIKLVYKIYELEGN